MKNLLPKKTQAYTFYLTSRFFDSIAHFLSGLSRSVMVTGNPKIMI